MEFLVSFLGRLPRSWLKTVSRLQWRHPFLKRLFELVAGQIRWREGAIRQGIGRGFGPNGHFVAFEPVAANAQQIKHNAELNTFTHVRVREEALADEDGQAAFRASAESGWGKLAHVGAVNQETAIIEVPVRKLDSVTAGGTLPRDHLIKIDVEGAEVDVLRGAVETLRAARPFLLVELHGTNAKVADLLLELDYQVGVLGSSASIRESPWYAQVLAWPSERCEAAGLAGLLSAAH
jgi:FkbM family methyltransferase